MNKGALVGTFPPTSDKSYNKKCLRCGKVSFLFLKDLLLAAKRPFCKCIFEGWR